MPWTESSFHISITEKLSVIEGSVFNLKPVKCGLTSMVLIKPTIPVIPSSILKRAQCCLTYISIYTNIRTKGSVIPIQASEF